MKCFTDGLQPGLSQYIEPLGVEGFTKAVDITTRWERSHPKDLTKIPKQSFNNKRIGTQEDGVL